MNKSLLEDFSRVDELLDLFLDFAKKQESRSLNYLSRGELLINTLREKAVRAVRTFTTDAFLEIIDANKYGLFTSQYDKQKYVLKRIRDCILRPAMRAYVPSRKEDDGTVHEGDASVFLKLLERLPMLQIVSRETSGSTPWNIAYRTASSTKRSFLDSVYLISCSTGLSTANLCIPFPEECHPTGSRNLSTYCNRYDRSREYQICDFTESFALVYLFCETKRLFDKELSTIQEDPERDYDTSPLCIFIKEEIAKLIETHSKFGMLYVLKDALKYQFVKDFLETISVPYAGITYAERPVDVKPLGLAQCFIPWLVTGSVQSLPISSHVWRGTEHYFDSAFSYTTETLMKLFDHISDEYFDEKRTAELQRQTSSEHARSFENLRGLSEKHIKFMSESGWNNYFSFTEFDPDSLMKDGEIAVEVLDEKGQILSTETILSHFKAVADVFGWEKTEGVSLRFRKLGNHHATGLWYPALLTLCVDVRHPSSFIHEYGHMRDTLAHNASRSDGFYEVKSRYSWLVRRAVEKDKSLGERIKGSKFNLDYYLTPTEIFARCFEIYMTRCCGISNILISPAKTESFAYPLDEALEEKIREFFDQFLAFNSEELFCKLHPETEKLSS